MPTTVFFFAVNGEAWLLVSVENLPMAGRPLPFLAQAFSTLPFPEGFFKGNGVEKERILGEHGKGQPAARSRIEIESS